MFEVKDKDFPQIDWTRGVYTMKLKSIETKQSKDRINPDTGDPEDFRLWIFDVLAPKKFKGEEFVDFSTMSFTPQSKPRRWVEGIMNRDLEEGERIEPDDIVGVPVHVQVGKNEKDRMAILSINPLPEDDSQEDEPVAVGTKATEEDLSEIPFS